ncbi:hypothetical protein F5B19DRAFT_125918 [Rostrohypoxylon terebratum]|nr:hypothetical protein F5B19DRAFT_125918 [Rostrohypoxylon terebratum]
MRARMTSASLFWNYLADMLVCGYCRHNVFCNDTDRPLRARVCAQDRKMPLLVKEVVHHLTQGLDSNNIRGS